MTEWTTPRGDNERMNTIPPMTDSLGQHWRQPHLDDIVIDDTHALMTERSFSQLAEYSTTRPSGVYPGKMWKSEYEGTWLLRWYGIVPGRDDLCSNNQREILRVAS